MLYPISFSVPEEIIVPYVPFKTCHTASHAYQFTEAEPYLKNYRSAIFGTTSLKCGWDAFRHYEILSQGTITYFDNLQGCPKQTLHSFPKEQVMSLMNKYGSHTFSEIMSTSSSILHNDLDELLTYTRTNLTTRSAAEYILSKTSTPTTNNVLFLHNLDEKVDYQAMMTAHGLIHHTNGQVDIYTDMEYLYSDYPLENTVKLYGRGFNYSRHISATLKKSLSEEQVWEKIKVRHYDQIILYIHCQSQRPIPFLSGDLDLHSYYSSSELSVVCGRDCDPYYDPNRDPNREWWIRDYHNCSLKRNAERLNLFVREYGD